MLALANCGWIGKNRGKYMAKSVATFKASKSEERYYKPLDGKVEKFNRITDAIFRYLSIYLSN